ncbi:MAG: helix-turn-helix domain-containing protein [Bacillota bacterium]|nr:helix-turn-helix domain-containing protein [Bacillota bacterium]
MQKDPLKLRELCERLRISNSTALRLLQKGELRAFRARGSWRIWERDLQAYVARQTTGGDEEGDQHGEY